MVTTLHFPESLWIYSHWNNLPTRSGLGNQSLLICLEFIYTKTLKKLTSICGTLTLDYKPVINMWNQKSFQFEVKVKTCKYFKMLNFDRSGGGWGVICRSGSCNLTEASLLFTLACKHVSMVVSFILIWINQLVSVDRWEGASSGDCDDDGLFIESVYPLVWHKSKSKVSSFDLSASAPKSQSKCF